MSSDLKLKIRHAKRANEKSLDLSGMGISELPADIISLSMLESLNISNNKLINLKRLENLTYLKELDASNNLIAFLTPEINDLYYLDTICLQGNPVVNTHPSLAKI